MLAKTLLWRISLPEKSNVHYLFGTMHLSSDDAYSSFDLAKNYMAKCAIYQAEMALDFDPQLQAANLRFRSGEQLSDFIPSRRYAKMDRMLKKSFGLPLATVQDIIPFYLIQLLTERVVATPTTHRLPLDYALWHHALSLGMNVGGLETIEEQMTVLHNIPHDVSLKTLHTIVRNPARFKESIRSVTKLYRAGDVNGLHIHARKQLGTLRSLLMYERNKVMAERLQAKLGGHATFSAVGAAHLGGNFGIISLLKKKGFLVRPIMS
jgi:uncharacterized protein